MVILTLKRANGSLGLGRYIRFAVSALVVSKGHVRSGSTEAPEAEIDAASASLVSRLLRR
jgi:hypothetical protein